MKNNWIYIFIFFFSSSAFCQYAPKKEMKTDDKMTANVLSIPAKIQIVKLSDAEWKQKLDEQSYYVMRQKGTEQSFTGKYWDNHEKGIYICNACKLPLFTSETKFESGTGWPSFFDPLRKDVVDVAKDDSHGMVRNEVVCARCNGHLGHVFEDGPKPTGLRYCMNSAALYFIPNGKIK